MIFTMFLESKDSYDKKSGKEILQDILGMLKALHWNYLTAHWQSKNDNFYANHLLFQRLYEGLVNEIDGLAEKMVSYYGEDAVAPELVLDITKKHTENWNKDTDLISRSLNAEKSLQKSLKTAYDTMKNSEEMTLGLDDFLMALANAHETNIYLLGRI